MTRTHKVVLVLALMLVAGVAGGVGAYAWSDGGSGGTDASGSAASSAAVDPSEVAQTSFPDLAAPTDDPELPGIDSAAPPPGSVVEVAGPFDDRFTLSEVRVSGGVVSGRLQVTSDVSEILELQVLAGFYGGGGRFLGTGRAVFHLDESAGHTHDDTGSPSELQEFRIAAPMRYADDVEAAAIGVPVLVNE